MRSAAMSVLLESRGHSEGPALARPEHDEGARLPALGALLQPVHPNGPPLPRRASPGGF
ncbi:hypothetical protein HMPREF1549_01659 [Actinomyces johnsonii F0510]|uniref:Uncharacterized protein n=1 Tax=Actinomyces johnsonii F0510 TaxID=1227262 RepID=U1PQY7_9ACTO|nr:hypothetical protein HMPREF1549_01659 [Actinomyces johnsonii F0510]